MNALTTADRSEEIERYLAGVAAALADLPGNLRQELLEDLPDHLAEIAADDPASLDSRLGPPPAYAAELRAAAGVDATTSKRRNDRWTDVVAAVRPHVHTVDERVGRLIGYDRLADLLVQLRPRLVDSPRLPLRGRPAPRKTRRPARPKNRRGARRTCQAVPPAAPAPAPPRRRATPTAGSACSSSSTTGTCRPAGRPAS